MASDREIYVNLAVADLDKSVTFFKTLGFEFNERFSGDKSACIIIGEKSFVMLLTRSSFEDFIPGKDIADASRTAETLVAVSVPSREAVDTMIQNAVAGGGSEYREAADHGWVYYRAFQDLDGHIWEVVTLEERQLPYETQDGEC